ncbi:hypothetical protein SALB_00594 [Streptomyces noursei]|uniref:Uncharacterized protein n=1 Tax=Streptomyces noursei TaxID=1971 RepID=A0A401QRE1_STRNR|nr:hypothetical protein SALB_00594 [Streptomyces noursei]
MDVDRVLGQGEDTGDLAVGQAAADRAEHFALLAGEFGGGRSIEGRGGRHCGLS